MKLISFKNTLLAIAGALLVSQTAQAGTPTYTAGDLFLGFRATGGTGATTYYVINIGQSSLYTAGSSFTLSLGSFGQDLTDIYGANWSSRSDLLWSVSGYSGTNTLFASKEGDGGVSAWGGLVTSARNNVVSQMTSMKNAYLGVGANSLNGTTAVTETSAISNNYASYTTGGTSWGVFNSGSLGVNGAINDAQGLDLYRVSSTSAGTHLGSFSISEDTVTPGASTLSFNAVPEPSTYALMVLGSFVLFWGMSRRKTLSRA